MRTTIRLDDEVLRRAKALAARTGRSLTAVIEDSLRATLARSDSRPPKPIRLKTSRGQLRAGLSLDSTADLLDQMEGID